MSRVDDAIRRAGERSTGLGADGSDVGAETSLFSGDPVELAREPFPIEMSEHNRHPQSSPPLQVEELPAIIEPARSDERTPDPPNPRPQLSLIERIDHSLLQKIVVDTHMMSSSREQYRRLAATLHHAQTATGLKVVMIASAAPGEGKTLTAANLGLTFSESYKRSVLLIDADLRRPALHTVFGTDNSSGLTEGLQAVTEQKVPVRQVSERLGLLQAGQASSDPMAGLTSERMRRLIAEAREAFDWVIIDSPPVALLPDANLLAAMVDGAVMVVNAGSTSYELVRRAIDTIGRQRILGVVLNRAETVPHGYGYEYYDAYYGAKPQAAPSS